MTDAALRPIMITVDGVRLGMLLSRSCGALEALLEMYGELKSARALLAELEAYRLALVGEIVNGAQP